MYRNPNSSASKEFWDSVKSLVNTITGPWKMVGNFNTIANNNESSGRGGSAIRSYHFANWINSLGMIDHGCMRSPYTWARGKNNNTRILHHPDRVLANSEWWICFLKASVHHLTRVFSDHAPFTRVVGIL